MRIDFAKTIVDEKFDLIYLAKILFDTPKLALRFLWLLSDIADYNSNYLYDFLTPLYQLKDKKPSVNIKEAFPKYWYLCGCPEEDKADALELTLNLIDSNDTNATIKTRSLNALMKLYEEYPDIRNEVISILENQVGKNLPSFERKLANVLASLK